MYDKNTNTFTRRARLSMTAIVAAVALTLAALVAVVVTADNTNIAASAPAGVNDATSNHTSR